jgi:hypothetical protein
VTVVDNLVIRDFGSVEVFRSDVDGRWVVQINTEPDDADEDPEIRVFVNDGPVFGSMPTEDVYAHAEWARHPPARARLRREVWTRFRPLYARDWGVDTSAYFRVVGCSFTGASRYVEMKGGVKVVSAVCLTYPGPGERP